MLKCVFIEYLVENEDRSNGCEYRLAKKTPPEIRKEMRKWHDRRVVGGSPYMVVDFLKEDIETGKARKDGDFYRRSLETTKTTTVGELIKALKMFRADACVRVYDSFGALVDPLELVDVGGGDDRVAAIGSRLRRRSVLKRGETRNARFGGSEERSNRAF